MKSRYEKVTLDQLSKIFSGFAFKSADLIDKSDEAYPIIKIANIQNKKVLKFGSGYLPKDQFVDKLEKYKLDKDDFLVAMTGAGSVGKVGKMRNPDHNYLVNQRVGIVRSDKEKVNPEYLFQVLSDNYYEEYLYQLGVGSGQPNVSAKDIGNLEVPYPDLDTQQKIASILSAFDDLIENNTRRIAILEEMARLIYREWFVNYHYPGHEKDHLVDSGTDLGDVPEGWEIGTIGDLYDVKSGFAFKSKKLVDQGSFGVIKIGNIQSGDIDVAGVQFIENDKVPERAVKFKLYPGDVLIAMTGAKVGKVGIMPKTKNPYYLNQRVGKYFSKNEALKSHMYLYAFLNSREAQVNIENLAQGAAQPNISATDLKSLKLPIPPEQILNEFEEFTLPMRDEMLTLRQKNVKLKETRDLLLPKLISGKVDIKEV